MAATTHLTSIRPTSSTPSTIRTSRCSSGPDWVYEGESDGELERVETIVTDEPRTVMGIAPTVVRDSVSLDDELIEDTYDWYAQDRDGNVWYLGEDATEYEDGEVVTTEGSWEAGVDGALPGDRDARRPGRRLRLPAGALRRRGRGPGRDHPARPSVEVPAGSFDDVVVTRDWNPVGARGDLGEAVRARGRHAPRRERRRRRRGHRASRVHSAGVTAAQSGGVQRRRVHDWTAMKRTTKLLLGGGAVAAVGDRLGVTFAVAQGGDDSEPPITGAALDQATEAALAHTGGGRVSGTEVGDEESHYEVEVTLDDGTQVDVQLDPASTWSATRPTAPARTTAPATTDHGGGT